MTSCGRLVAAASEMIGREEVVVARIAPGLQISSRFSNSMRLDLEVLGDRLDDEVDVGRGRRARCVPVSRREHLARGRPPRACRAGSPCRATARWSARTPSTLVLAAADVDHVVAGLGEDLDDARWPSCRCRRRRRA